MAADNNAQIAQQFQSVLGRIPTKPELDYYGKFISEGQIQPFEVGKILQSTPEFQQSFNNSQLQKNVDLYGQQLGASDNNILQQGAQMAGQAAKAQFAGLGRPETSAIASQVFGQTGQLAQGLAQNRQSALASFYGQGLQQNTNQLANSYAGIGQGIQNRAYGLRDQAAGWQHELENYHLQQNDYNNALPGQATRNMQGILTGKAVNTGADIVGGLIKGAVGGLFSDIRLKSDIVRIGSIGNLPLYEFNYKNIEGFNLPTGRRVGFMAHEVEKIFPEAVHLDRGFKKVDYEYLRRDI